MIAQVESDGDANPSGFLSKAFFIPGREMGFLQLYSIFLLDKLECVMKVYPHEAIEVKRIHVASPSEIQKTCSLTAKEKPRLKRRDLSLSTEDEVVV